MNPFRRRNSQLVHHELHIDINRMNRGLLYIALAIAAGMAVLAEVPSSYPGQVTYPPPFQLPTTPAPAINGPYAHQFAGYYNDLPSYGVQTGYEGFLVPTKQEEEEEEDFSLLSLLPSQYFWLLPILSSLGSPFKLIAKLGFLLLGPLTLVILGGLLTVGVCVFTPICTLTFLGFGLKRENVRGLLTPDRLSSLSAFVTKAIEKYQAMQKKKFPKKAYAIPKVEKNELVESAAPSTVESPTKDRRK